MSQIIDLPSDDDCMTDAAMLRALGTIMRRGAFGNEEVELLAAIAGDGATDVAERSFARQSMSWLAQQLVVRSPRIWTPNDDARH